MIWTIDGVITHSHFDPPQIQRVSDPDGSDPEGLQILRGQIQDGSDPEGLQILGCLESEVIKSGSDQILIISDPPNPENDEISLIPPHHSESPIIWRFLP